MTEIAAETLIKHYSHINNWNIIHQLKGWLNHNDQAMNSANRMITGINIKR